MTSDEIHSLHTIGIIASIIGIIVLVILFKRIKKSILSVFGGSIELPEVGGVIGVIYLGYMIVVEGQRTNLQYHVYNELYIFFVAGMAMTGLGLKDVLNAVKEIRGQAPINKTEEIKITQKTTVDESEAPK